MISQTSRRGAATVELNRRKMRRSCWAYSLLEGGQNPRQWMRRTIVQPYPASGASNRGITAQTHKTGRW